MRLKNPSLESLVVTAVTLAFCLAALGCGEGDGDFVPGVLDGGSPPNKDTGVKKDTGKKPPIKKDTGTKPPIKKDTGTKPPIKKDKGTPPPKKDKGTPPPKLDKGTPPPKLDKGTPPPPKDSGPPPKSYKVAAVQYGSGYAASVSPVCAKSATPNACALKALVAQAKKAGAYFVVLPEYALGKDQKYYEPVPKIGENPGTNPQWPAKLFIKQFSQAAKQHNVYLIFNVATYSVSKVYHNTVIAFNPGGGVVGVHHKFNLFGNETKSLTPGKNVSVFNTPLGKMGMLICADIYGSAGLRGKLKNQLQARVVTISSYWTVANSVNWYKKYTSDWGVYAIVSNTTHSPGMGGGVYNPSGQPMAQKIQAQPSIVYAVIPTP